MGLALLGVLVAACAAGNTRDPALTPGAHASGSPGGSTAAAAETPVTGAATTTAAATTTTTSAGAPTTTVGAPTTSASAASLGREGDQCRADAPCGAGLACCYPCGIAGCKNVCMAVGSQGGCPRRP